MKCILGFPQNAPTFPGFSKLGEKETPVQKLVLAAAIPFKRSLWLYNFIAKIKTSKYVYHAGKILFLGKAYLRHDWPPKVAGLPKVGSAQTQLLSADPHFPIGLCRNMLHFEM